MLTQDSLTVTKSPACSWMTCCTPAASPRTWSASPSPGTTSPGCRCADTTNGFGCFFPIRRAIPISARTPAVRHGRVHETSHQQIRNPAPVPQLHGARTPASTGGTRRGLRRAWRPGHRWPLGPNRIVQHADVLTLDGASYRLRGRGMTASPTSEPRPADPRTGEPSRSTNGRHLEDCPMPWVVVVSTRSKEPGWPNILVNSQIWPIFRE